MQQFEELQDGDIIEPDQWRNPEESAFNHQALVMQAMRKCLESGSKELREGYFNEKVDKFGNVRREWVEDTRKVFIESVKSLLMVVACDYDEEANKIIPALLSRIEERRKYWIDQEWRFWCSLNPMQQQALAKEGKHVQKGFFNKKLDFDNYFFEEETQLYREVCTEVNKLTERLDYYGQVGYMN